MEKIIRTEDKTAYRLVGEGDICYFKETSKFRHRVDGPAWIWYKDGAEFWYMDNKLHRLDGPAAIYPSGRAFYWIWGVSFGTDLEFYLKEVEKFRKGKFL